MKRDLYAEVSARIVAELEAGAIPASVRLMPSSPFDLLASRRPAEPLHPRFSAGLAKELGMHELVLHKCEEMRE